MLSQRRQLKIAWVGPCSICKQSLHPSMFRLGEIRCRDCETAYARVRRSREHVSVMNKASRLKRYKKEQARRANLKHKYNITLEEYEVMLARQNGVCALCGTTRTDKRGRSLFVDHDHETGRLRGILCQQCNSAVGTLGDTVESLSRVVSYLKGELF